MWPCKPPMQWPVSRFPGIPQSKYGLVGEALSCMIRVQDKNRQPIGQGDQRVFSARSGEKPVAH